MSLADKFRRFLAGSKLNVEDRFEILRTAASGTMSSFYQVRDKRTGDIVGLKVCDVEKTKAFEARFVGLHKPSEGEISIKMDHPLVVKAIAHGLTTKGERYLLMEFLDGPGINTLIVRRSEKLDGKRYRLVEQMCTALKYVHDQGYIHRDICPRNFICAPDLMSVKLIDFGLTVPATKEFMQPGNRTGTPNFMAPEVIRRRSTDKRLDVFALGVTLFQMCTFELPWPGQDASGNAAVIHDSADPSDIFKLRPKLDPEFGKLVMSCLEVDPGRRPASMDDILRRMQKVEPSRV